MDDVDTRAERRERRKRNREKMKVSGSSTKKLWRIMVEKAQRLENKPT